MFLKQKRHSRWWLLIFAAALLLIYFPSLRGEFLWDDFAHIPLARPEFYRLEGLRFIWKQQGFTQQYYPLSFTTIWIAHHLWGLHALGYRLLTLIFHGLNALCVFILLTELEVPAALWAAFLFALHPLQVETVAWISEIKNTQSTFFYFLSLIWYLRVVHSRRPVGGAYVTSFLFYLGALFSKTVSCSLPIVALSLIWYKRRRLAWKDVLNILPFIASGLLVGFRTAYLERHLIGALGPAWDLSFSERVRIAGHAFWFYIGKLFWPHPLLFMYAHWSIHKTDFIYPGSALICYLVFWIQRRRWGAGPFVAFFVFGTTLFPALGFFNIYPMRYSFVADHFQYLPGVALFALFAGTMSYFARRFLIGPFAQRAIAIGLCIFLGGLSWARAHTYQTSEKLWRDILAKDPKSLIANVNLANELLLKQAVGEARGYINKVVQLYPEDINAELTLGHLRLHFEHDPVGAIDPFRRANDAIENLPESHAADGLRVFVHELLGDAYFQAHRESEAKIEYETALKAIVPLRARMYFDTTPQLLDNLCSDMNDHLAQIATVDGKLDEAIAQSQKAVSLKPTEFNYNLHLAQALENNHKLTQAEILYEKILVTNPNAWQAHAALGDLLKQRGRREEAVGHYQQAVDLNPEAADLRDKLGTLLLKLGRQQEAIAVFRVAVRPPSHPKAPPTATQSGISFPWR